MVRVTFKPRHERSDCRGSNPGHPRESLRSARGLGKIMIETKDDGLSFSFPDVHPSATLHITFQRTLRIPDDDKTYPLPPGLGEFPLRHVDDFANNVPASWLEHGGVMLPM